MTTTYRDRLRQHRQRRDRLRAGILAQVQRLGYRVRGWKEAEQVARRLTRRH